LEALKEMVGNTTNFTTVDKDQLFAKEMETLIDKGKVLIFKTIGHSPGSPGRPEEANESPYIYPPYIYFFILDFDL